MLKSKDRKVTLTTQAEKKLAGMAIIMEFQKIYDDPNSTSEMKAFIEEMEDIIQRAYDITEQDLLNYSIKN